MAYNATYEAADAAPAAIDVVVGVLAAFGLFATLIGLIMVYNWFRKNTKGLR